MSAQNNRGFFNSVQTRPDPKNTQVYWCQFRTPSAQARPPHGSSVARRRAMSTLVAVWGQHRRRSSPVQSRLWSRPSMLLVDRARGRPSLSLGVALFPSLSSLHGLPRTQDLGTSGPAAWASSSPTSSPPRPPPFPLSIPPYFGPDLGRELWRPPPPPASGSRYVALGSLVFSVCRLFFFDTDGRDRRCVRRASPPLLRSRPPSERLCGHRSRRDHLFAGAVPDLWTWAWLLS